ncbi:MAG: NAD(P)-dependent oxidoreductase [Eubacterium sp.]|nr:NAD(P)-dependent oxidoreductase [Eubacterium sp.]
MEVALIGARSYLSDALIDRFSKEGDRVYVLTGHEYVTKKVPKVFEQYNFSYVNESIPQIFESINPDAVVFMGEYDTNFPEQVEHRHVLEYSTGLVNILSSVQNLNRKIRFIYLSSERVYEESDFTPINELKPANPSNGRQYMVRQGEMTVNNYKSEFAIDPIVLRLDHLYGIPTGKVDLPRDLGRMCAEANENSVIHADPANEFSMLHVMDAVQYIYTALKAKEHRYDLYHISSGNVFNETQLANLVAEGWGKNVEVEEVRVKNSFKRVLDGEAFLEEFDARVFDKPEVSVPRVVSEISRHSRRFFAAPTQEKKSAGKIGTQISDIIYKLIPYIENSLMFIVFFMLNNRATGSEYFSNIDFLLLYVIFFAVVFGQQQATYSAVLATAGYLFRQQYDRSVFDVVLDYNTYVWIAQLFIIGLVVGYMKDRLKSIKEEDNVEINYLSRQRDDIFDINMANVQIKNVLETQLINQNDSFGKVYSITSTLDQYEPEDVLFYAAQIVQRLIETGDVAIYTVDNDRFARLFAATSATARSLGNSIKYTELTDMYEEFSNNRVYINKNMDEKYPLMADAIYDQDRIRLIIMAWGIPWDRMNLGQANMLRVIGFLIQNALVRANSYMSALEQQRFDEGGKVLKAEAFSSLLKAFVNAQRNSLTVVTVVAIDGDPESKELVEKLDRLTRASDYLGLHSDGKLYVLLSNTDEENSGFVMNRFKENDIKAKRLTTKELYSLVEAGDGEGDGDDE